MIAKLKAIVEEIADFIGWIFADPLPVLAAHRAQRLRAAGGGTAAERLFKGEE